MSDDSITLLRDFLNGADSAASQIYDRYVQQLIVMVRKRLRDDHQARYDAEDVVQSAYRSFFRRAAEGDFVIERSGDLWRLLAGIAIKKLLSKREHEAAQRRDPRREVSAELQQLIASDPSEAIQNELVEELVELMNATADRDRRALELRLQDASLSEIAANLDCSEATVRRLLHRLRDRLEERLWSE